MRFIRAVNLGQSTTLSSRATLTTTDNWSYYQYGHSNHK